jgi:hypothetical protein
MSNLADWYQPPAYRAFIATPFKAVHAVNTSNAALANRDLLDLVTVAFNNDVLISRQIHLLRENLRDPYHYTVIDNSNRPDVRDRIAELCACHRVAYVALPRNPFSVGSRSHGAALNWAYRHYVAPRKARYWGSIDHDLFPIRPTRIIPRLQVCGLYGHAQDRGGDVWYFWPGFSFFAAALTQSVVMNFLPVSGLDTGGANWPLLYSRFPRSVVPTPRQTKIFLRAGGNSQSDAVERFDDDWLHMINGSSWAGDDGKLELFEALLRQSLEGQRDGFGR